MIERYITFPCDDGPLTVYLKAESARVVDHFDLLARCNVYALDKTREGLDARIRRNFRADPEHVNLIAMKTDINRQVTFVGHTTNEAQPGSDEPC